MTLRRLVSASQTGSQAGDAEAAKAKAAKEALLRECADDDHLKNAEKEGAEQKALCKAECMNDSTFFLKKCEFQ